RIAVRRRREIREAVLPRVEPRAGEPQWFVQLLTDEHVQWAAAHALDDVAQQHEPEVAVLPARADLELQRQPVDVRQRLRRVTRVIVDRLPAVEPGGMREERSEEHTSELQ